MFENLLLAREAAVAVVTINRPQVLNALNAATLDELRHAIVDVTHDASVRAVIITGAGEKSFVAGADIAELAAQRPSESRDHARRGQQVFDLIDQMGKPVIAAINGYALGGGCELAMACTFRIAADTARLGQPEISLGLIPGFAGTQRLARLVGRGAALDLLLTGRQVTAQEAQRIGLVHRMVAAADLMTEARTLASELADKAPIAVRCILEAVNRGLDATLGEAQALEAALFGVVASTDDMREGTAAFLEKRKPIFMGR
jgi:enoyl-CoA hydratase/carnithine racemase